MQEKIVMTPETKCVETLVVIAVTTIIVLVKKDIFPESVKFMIFDNQLAYCKLVS